MANGSAIAGKETPRHDTVDATGVVTPRPRRPPHARTRILMLINDRHIRIAYDTTGALIRELVLDPTRDYQPLKINKPNP